MPDRAGTGGRPYTSQTTSMLNAKQQNPNTNPVPHHAPHLAWPEES